jgi:hypothetical protein
MCLGICGRGETHRLFVLPSPCRQLVTGLEQGLPQTNDVSVTEYREDASEQRLVSVVGDDALRHEMPYERLRHRKA